MLAEDFLGAQRDRFEDPLRENYIKAVNEIEADPNNKLIVAEQNGEVVGTLQLTYIPSISFHGGKRCTVESVRVDEKYRGKGIGREMMLWAIERAKERNCISMQLTTNNDRTEAHRFYEHLGFSNSHIGMKLKLWPPKFGVPALAGRSVTDRDIGVKAATQRWNSELRFSTCAKTIKASKYRKTTRCRRRFRQDFPHDFPRFFHMRALRVTTRYCVMGSYGDVTKYFTQNLISGALS